MRRIRSASEASRYRGKLVAYTSKYEYRNKGKGAHNGHYFAYVDPKVDNWGTREFGHELTIVFGKDEIQSRQTLLDSDMSWEYQFRLATPQEIGEIIQRVRKGELKIGLSDREQERVLRILEKGQDNNLLEPAREEWKIRF